MSGIRSRAGSEAYIAELQAEVERLRWAINEHRSATRYNMNKERRQFLASNGGVVSDGELELLRKAKAYDRARSEVKVDGNTRAEYVLQRDAALAEVERLREAQATLTSVRVWAEIVEARHSDERVQRFARMLLGMLDGDAPASDEKRASDMTAREFVRDPRRAFNADEADCCTCVGTCDRRTDGICRCLPLAPSAT